MNGLLIGAGFLWRGVRLIRTRHLRRYVMVPLLVNCAVFGAVTFVLFDYLELLVEWLLGYLPQWLDWLRKRGSV